MVLTKDLWVAYTRIFFVELAYWLISISLVFVNEFILGTELLTDDLTIFITVFQIIFSLSILVTLNYITKKYLFPSLNTDRQDIRHLDKNSISLSTKLPHQDELDSKSHNEDDDKEALIVDNHVEPKGSDNSDSLMNLLIVNIPHRINLETCKMVFSLSTLYIGMLLLNNFCLKSVGVAFYFVSRSLTTVFNVAFTYFLMNEPISRGAFICCVFIILGFLLGIDQESVIGGLSVIGVTFGVTSSLFTSLFSIYTKKTLAKLDRNIWVLVLYNNINAIVICTPLLIIHGDIQALISDKVISPQFWLLLSISGVMSFFISIVTNASIKYTSPLTHNISGTAKACFQTVIAVIYKHDHKSTLWWISNITILVASAAYSRIKQLEMEQKSSNLPNIMDKRRTPDISSYNTKTTLNRRDSSSSGCSATSDSLVPLSSGDCCSVKLQPHEKVST